MLAADARRLRSYRDRGWCVEGASIDYLQVTVDVASATSVQLTTTDVLGPAVAVSADGARRPLPRDLPTTHRIRLALIGDAWRIASIELATR